MALSLLKVNNRNTESDCRLLDRLLQGDNDIVAVIYDRYAQGMFSVLTAICRTQADAEDALQETFLKLAQGRINKAADLRAYLYTVARHEAYNLLRRKKRECPMHILPERIADPATGTVEWQELLHTLPVEQREVIAMKVYEEMTFDEIASIVGASSNTVASRYRYGIAKLREVMKEE